MNFNFVIELFLLLLELIEHFLFGFLLLLEDHFVTTAEFLNLSIHALNPETQLFIIGSELLVLL